MVDPILRQTQEPPLLHEFNRFWGIPIDTTDIYWGDGAGVVNQAPLGGGTASQVVAGLPVYGLAIDDTYLYWTAYGADQKGLVLKAQK